ncbi:MAG: family 43 glycosylhydrolase [Prolixibacteraceae bacterium]
MGKAFFILLCLIILSCRQQGVLKLDRAATMLSSGGEVQMKAFDAQSGRPMKVSWESSNPDIATVNRKGVVKGVSKGDVIIMAVAPETGDTASCLVSVDVPLQNPVLPPSWKLYFPDPEPKLYDDGVYVYGSKDVDYGIMPTGKNWCSDRYHVLWSEDLIHWTDKGMSFHLDSVKGKYWHPQYKRLYAPDVARNPADGKYYLYFCFNHTRPEREEIFMVAVSDKPEGPFLNPRPLLIDGQETIQAIDPGVMVDDDGKAYVTWPFMMGQLDPDDFTNILGNTVVDVKQWMPEENTPFEGPSLRKRGDTYYYIYIENEGLRQRPDGTWNNKPTRMAYMTSKQPLGPYTYQGLIIANSDYPEVINIHGSLVGFENNWYVFYHMPVPDKRLTRQMCIEPLFFNHDGTIIYTEPSTSGIKGSFSCGDRINAAGAVIYPGNELNPGYVSREKDYAKLVFSKPGSYAGYRYFDAGADEPGSVLLNVQTTDEGAVMELRMDKPDGEMVSEIKLSDTNGQWQQVHAETREILPGKRNFYLVMKDKPKSGSVEIDWFMFNKG